MERQHPLRAKDLKKPGALGATASSSTIRAAGAGWAGGRRGCRVEWLNLQFVSPCGCQSSKNQTLSQERSTYRILCIISGIQAKVLTPRELKDPTQSCVLWSQLGFCTRQRPLCRHV